MKSAAEHVEYQLPNGPTRVRYLLEIIKCDNAALMARISNIQYDQDPDGKLQDFGKAVAFFLLACPMALCLARRESIVTKKTAEISTMTLKEGMGCTGVKLRWYPRT